MKKHREEKTLVFNGMYPKNLILFNFVAAAADDDDNVLIKGAP